MKIVIAGTGNVATIMGRKIKQAGHEVIQVCGRNVANAAKLAEELSSRACNSWQEIDHSADFYLVALSDEALYQLNGQVNLEDKLVVHTAGSVSKDVLKTVSSSYGVLYPLQSLRKELAPGTEIPLLIDANNTAGKQIIRALASGISGHVAEAGDTQRMKLHVAAVIASNFTNHLYALAQDYCKAENLDFTLLYPLIEETALRIRLADPETLQTGPAARNDSLTINRHIELLDNYPAIQQLYTLLTGSIKEKR